MEVKIVVNGSPVTISCDTVDQVQALLASLSGSQNHPTQDEGESTKSTVAMGSEEYDEDDVLVALRYMQGNPSATILLHLAESDSGCTDRELKELMGVEKIAAHLSHVSKCCKKAGISKEAVMTSRTKRLGRGKMLYHYKITALAKKAITAIDRFGEEGVFADFEDFELSS